MRAQGRPLLPRSEKPTMEYRGQFTAAETHRGTHAPGPAPGQGNRNCNSQIAGGSAWIL